MSKEMTIWY